jgi:hypothetical protein
VVEDAGLLGTDMPMVVVVGGIGGGGGEMGSTQCMCVACVATERYETLGGIIMRGLWAGSQKPWIIRESQCI